MHRVAGPSTARERSLLFGEGEFLFLSISDVKWFVDEGLLKGSDVLKPPATVMTPLNQSH